MRTRLESQLEVFFGQATATEARVYVELRGAQGDEIELRGAVRGPTSAYARTLPASIPLREIAGGKTLLAEAVVPDPCFWTAESPYCYHVEVELRRDEVVRKMEQLLGIRPLSTRANDLVFDGRRWVLRGVKSGRSDVEQLPAWHETGTSMLVDHPSEELCAQASRQGVLLVARVDGNSDDDLLETLWRLSRHPSVGIAAVRVEETPGDLAERLPRNLLLAQVFYAPESVAPCNWAHLALCEIADDPSQLADRLAGCPLPVLIYRPQGEHATPGEARTACDHLQRDLARMGDFAGYIV